MIHLVITGRASSSFPIRRPPSRHLAAMAVWLLLGGALSAQVPQPGSAEPAHAGSAAAALLGSQRFAEALRVVDEALGPLVATREGDDREVLTLRILRGQALYGLGRPADAIEALAPFAAAPPSAPPLVSIAGDWNALTVLGDSFMALDRWSDALDALERARAMLAEGGIGARFSAIDAATTLGKVGTARARLEDWPGAREAFEAQVAVLGEEDGGGGPYLAAAHNGLGLVADNVGDLAAAAEHYAVAAEIYERRFGLEHPYAKRALTTLARVRGKLGQTQEADRITARLAAVDAVPQSISPTLEPVVTPIPAPPAAAPRPLLTWPVIAAAAAAVILVGLAASGSLGRRASRRPDAAAARSMPEGD